MYKADKVPIDERSVIRRCNRFLQKDKHRLCKNRPTRSSDRERLTEREAKLGTFYIMTQGKNAKVVQRRVDLEEFARKHGIVAPFEVIVYPT